MQCPHCNQQHPEGSLFCPLTGKPTGISTHCAACGNPVDADWRHCSVCGASLNPARETPEDELKQPKVHPARPAAKPKTARTRAPLPKALWLLIAAAGAGLLLVGIAAISVFFKLTSGGDLLPLFVNTRGATSEIEAPIAPNETSMPAVFETASGRIAFESTRDGNLEIYTMKANGSDTIRLTNNPAADSDPNWSADGKKIAFTTNRDGNWEIYVMDADGSNPRNISNNAGDEAYPAWSADGRKIAFTSNRDGNQEIYLMDVDGSQQTRLTTDERDDNFPDWSPDGKNLVFQSNPKMNYDDFEIQVMNSFGSGRTNLTTNSGCLYPAWSGDGKKIAYISNGSRSWEIYVMNADGSEPVILTEKRMRQTYPKNFTVNSSPVWSGDGLKIVFVSARDGNAEIYMMNADGSNQTNLSNNAAYDGFPDWYSDAAAVSSAPAADPTPTPLIEPENDETTTAESLTDPNMACVFHLIDQPVSQDAPEEPAVFALSCLEQDGWHVYKTEATMDSFLQGDWLAQMPVNPWPNAILPLKFPTQLTQCPGGRIYATWEGNIFLLDGSRLTEIGPDGYSGTRVLACGKGDDIWVNLVKDSGNYDLSVPGNYDLDAEHVLDPNVEISHFDGRLWTHYPAIEHLGSKGVIDLIRSISTAPDGDVWVVTGGSIAVFDGFSWQVFEEGNGFEKNPAAGSLAFDTLGNVWVVNNYGLLKYDGIQWSTFYDEAPQYIYYSHQMAVDRENRIWVAIDYENKIYVFDPQTRRWTLQIDEKDLSAQLLDMQFDRLGRLWIATHYGLYIYDGSRITAYFMNNSDLYANAIDSLIVFGDGPALPSPVEKETGSIRGRLSGADLQSYQDLSVEICAADVGRQGYITRSCAGSDQAYHATTSVDADGNFVFDDVPPGRYYIKGKTPQNDWIRNYWVEVTPGGVTQGDVVLPQK
jgi:Tol biopolymer transport system component